MSRGAANPELSSSVPSLAGIQRLVHDVLDGVIATVGELLEAQVPFVNEVSFHLQQMRGKLFRPALLALANRVEGTPDERETRLGAVVEIIHLATLVHDDLIDDADVRRGMATLHARWGHKVSVVMGDYLYSRAMSEMARMGSLDLIELAAQVTHDMTIGEMVEVGNHRRLVEDPEQYFFMIEKKTASLIAAACEMGARIGAPRFRQPLRDYGQRLGMVFQLVDDALDYGGEQTAMGKAVGIDLRGGQVTFPLLAVLPLLSPAERRLVKSVVERDGETDPAALEEVVGLVRERGGIAATRRMAARYAEAARQALGELPPTPVRDVLDAAVDYVLARDR
jgi:octaprenyl-diphosphate synthase